MFQKPNPRPNFDALELAILDWWKSNDILGKSINQRDPNNARVFYDGPITANGAPHGGHLLTFAMKDIFPRYWTMQGYYVNRSVGWDCQGLPVELEVEKNLGIDKSKIESEIGIAEFNRMCRELVEKFRAGMINFEERIGRLTNSDEEYATMDPDYIESIWWSLAELHKKDLLYEGFKVVPFSTAVGTSLSNAEVGLGGYKEFTDPAITVAFPLSDEPNTSVLAWTTTPWTIPGNLGLAVGKEIAYAKVAANGKNYIVAKDLVSKVFKEGDYEILSEVSADDLIGKPYEPPFNLFKGRANAHKIYAGDHVTTDSGTGIVHLAPYGAEDYDIFQQVGIEAFDYLDDQGHFTDEVPAYAGQFYKKANENIVSDLEKAGKLFKSEQYVHEMPTCWRTGVPLIYKPIRSWYVAVSKMRTELVANNDKINWVPEHMKEGRFGNWLREIKDWGISRKRYWGTPIPVWKSPSGKVKVIGSFEELKNLSGVQLDDPHRPFVDDVKFIFEGEEYTRIPDVLDVWYDSGAMPFARFHYPFENKEKFESKFPAEYIAEGVDQTRGWFYSLHAIGTTVFGTNVFKNVVVNGFTLDDKGVKHSKSKKNYSDPSEMLANFGADAIRWNYFSSPLVIGEDATVSDNSVKLQLQEFILPLWNTFVYLTTYASLHEWEPREELAYNKRANWTDAHPWDHIPFDSIDDELDAWIIWQLQQTIGNVTKGMDNYTTPVAARALQDFLGKLSKWYIRRARDRFASGDQRAIETLYYVLVEFVKLAAPFVPFITEEIYRTLVGTQLKDAPESVHLTDYPVVDLDFVQQYANLSKEMEVVQQIAELGQSLRTQQGIKVRQPLSELEVHFGSEANKQGAYLTEWMKALLESELNVLKVTEVPALAKNGVVPSTSYDLRVYLNTEITPELAAAGLLRELIRKLQALRKEMKLEITDKVSITWETEDAELKKLLEEKGEEIKTAVNAVSLIQGIGDQEVLVNDKGLKLSISK